mgnify:CR=1 FL=1
MTTSKLSPFCGSNVWLFIFTIFPFLFYFFLFVFFWYFPRKKNYNNKGSCFFSGFIHSTMASLWDHRKGQLNDRTVYVWSNAFSQTTDIFLTWNRRKGVRIFFSLLKVIIIFIDWPLAGHNSQWRWWWPNCECDVFFKFFIYFLLASFIHFNSLQLKWFKQGLVRVFSSLIKKNRHACSRPRFVYRTCFVLFFFVVVSGWTKPKFDKLTIVFPFFHSHCTYRE